LNIVCIQVDGRRDRHQTSDDIRIGSCGYRSAGHKSPGERAAASKGDPCTYVEVNVAGLSAIDQQNRGGAGGDKSCANLDDEAGLRIVLSVEGQHAARSSRGVKMVNAGRQCQATEVAAGKIIGW
jgi:hypothetical protein